MDAWINKIQGKSFDKDGHFAQQGKPLPRLLALLLNDPYFTLEPPKSTGREKFNLLWLEQQLLLCEGESFAPADIQRTLLEFTAITILDQIVKYSATCDVFVCGGGALNSFLMQRLQDLMPAHNVHDTHTLGVDPMFVEAIAFAWLAEQRLLEKTIPLKSVTGARQDAILGALYLSL